MSRFEIKEVKVNNIKALFNYSNNELTIELGKTYKKIRNKSTLDWFPSQVTHFDPRIGFAPYFI